jgi:hypothetical protein
VTTLEESPTSGAALIELRLDQVSHLFDPFDPVPMPTRDLSQNAEEFIVGWARELPRNQPIHINIHAALTGSSAEPEHIRVAVARHFAARAARMRGDRNQLLATGQVSLLIGMAVLALCVGLRQLLRTALPHSPLSDFVGEILVILGSVANWRPLEIFLYQWWPIDSRRRLFERLAMASVEVSANDSVGAR